jgi:hypothetical protein
VLSANGNSVAIANNGTFNVNNGLQTVGPISGNGVFNVTGTATVSAPSMAQGSASVASAATLNLTGPGASSPSLTIANSGTLNVTGGSLHTAASIGVDPALGGNTNGNLNVTGAGTKLSAGQVFQNNVNVGAGATLALTAATSADYSTVNSLTLAGSFGGNWNSRLDVGASGFTINNATTTQVSNVGDQIAEGAYNPISGAFDWSGTLGITSKSAAAHPTKTSIGYTYDGGVLTVAAAIPGDTNLDGVVDLTDLQAVKKHLGTADPASVAGWEFGDLNYDGVVDTTDLQIIKANYGSQAFPALAVAGASGGAGAVSVSPVPEPGTVALLAAALAVACIAVVGRRARIAG